VHYRNEARTSEVPDNLALGNHEELRGIEEFPLIILVLEKYMIRVLLLQTYASQPSLLKISLTI
jgi:hypothetical protein